VDSPVEIIGLTWRGTKQTQQDSMLIHGQVIQHNNGITPLYQIDDAFCIAVADGVSSSPKAERASRAALQAVNSQWQDLQQPIKLEAVQQKICETLANSPMTYGSSTTIVILQRLKKIDGSGNQIVQIQHVGDSRAYLFRQNIGWECMTIDHTMLESLRETSNIQDGQEYASIYKALDKYLIADWFYDDLPRAEPQRITVTKNDWILVCSDGVHDLVSSEYWPPCAEGILLSDWLRELRALVYKAGAWDNGSAIVARWV
jgi:serine/threonine protein phosphatase PrpC